MVKLDLAVFLVNFSSQFFCSNFNKKNVVAQPWLTSQTFDADLGHTAHGGSKLV